MSGILECQGEERAMADQPGWSRIAVIGAGAVGGYFGGLLAHAGAPVVMVGRLAFVESVKSRGLFLDTLQFRAHVQVEASTDLSAARDAEVILFCVKSTDNAATARELASFLSRDSTVISRRWCMLRRPAQNPAG